MRTMRMRPYSTTPMVRNLLVANVAIFLLQVLNHAFGVLPFGIERWFALFPDDVVNRLYFWQLISYQFLHGGLFHILVNMFVLWMFGTELERRWGSVGFLRFYLTCGVVAGIVMILFHYGSNSATVGASGAILGLLGAYAVLWPDREVYLLLFFILPIRMKIKYMVALVGGVSLIAGVLETQAGIAHMAHLGGLAMGLLYTWLGDPREPFVAPLKRWFQQRKVEQKKQEWEQHQKRREKMVREADRILDRLRKMSWEDLTERERRRIKEISEELDEMDRIDQSEDLF